MKILYTAVGDSDPIRGCHDGSMLHIVRHYNPDLVVIMLTKDMEQKQLSRGIYSKAIHSVNPHCKVELIPIGVENAHKIDEFTCLTDKFYELREDYADAQILINLSSGTPQMKTIFSYLSISDPMALGIQVSSPIKGSNRHEHAAMDTDDVELLIETNIDNDEASESRCEEPNLNYIRNHQVKSQLKGYIQSFQYKEALGLLSEYKKTLPPERFDGDIEKLLRHANARNLMDYQGALEYIRKSGKYNLSNGIQDKEISSLWEYLMIIDIRRRVGLYDEMIIRMTPYLYTLVKHYMKLSKKIDWDEVAPDRFSGDGRKTGVKKGSVDLEKLQSKHPHFHRIIRKNGSGSGVINLSFNHMNAILQEDKGLSDTIRERLQSLRDTERNIRNTLAHEIESVATLGQLDKGKIESIYSDMRKLYKDLIGSSIPANKDNVYDTINRILLEKLNAK